MPRQAQLDAPGTMHHVMVRGIEKRKMVDDGKDREAFVGRLGQVARSTGTAIYARSLLAGRLVRELGIPPVEAVRLLGVTTPAIAKALQRAGSK